MVRSFYRRENAAARAYEERCEHIQALLENYLDRPLYPGELDAGASLDSRIMQDQMILRRFEEGFLDDDKLLLQAGRVLKVWFLEFMVLYRSPIVGSSVDCADVWGAFSVIDLMLFDPWYLHWSVYAHDLFNLRVGGRTSMTADERKVLVCDIRYVFTQTHRLRNLPKDEETARMYYTVIGELLSPTLDRDLDGVEFAETPSFRIGGVPSDRASPGATDDLDTFLAKQKNLAHELEANARSGLRGVVIVPRDGEGELSGLPKVVAEMFGAVMQKDRKGRAFPDPWSAIGEPLESKPENWRDVLEEWLKKEKKWATAKKEHAGLPIGRLLENWHEILKAEHKKNWRDVAKWLIASRYGVQRERAEDSIKDGEEKLHDAERQDQERIEVIDSVRDWHLVDGWFPKADPEKVDDFFIRPMAKNHMAKRTGLSVDDLQAVARAGIAVLHRRRRTRPS